MTPKAAERDMTAHIPEGSGEDADRDMSAKTDIGEGIHTTSSTLGKVVSHHETDAAGLTPEKMAERAEARTTSGKKKPTKK